MKLIISNKISSIIDPTKEVIDLFKNFFTLKDERKAFVKSSDPSKRFNNKKIESVKFYYFIDNKIVFFSGLLVDVLKTIKKNNIKIDIDNRLVSLEYQGKDYSDEELRKYFNPNFTYVDHQIRALKKMLKSYGGIIKATTASGKTEIVLAFCKLVNLKTLILVNKQDLGKQTAKRLNDGGFPVIYRGSDKKGKVNLESSYVCTIGMAKDLPNDFDIVIVDECHRASAATFQDYLMKSKAKAFYGFSATPEGNHKVDFMKVKQHLYGIIEEINAEELLENNVIAFPNITFIDNECIGTLDWDSANKLCIIHNRDRNEKIRDLVFKHKQSTLILVRNIEHGLELEKMIEGSLFVHGSKDSDFRKDVIDRMESGDLKYVIASNIFNEGISINAIRVLIVASGGKSKIETVQRLGRALRKDEGKEEAIVYDFYDYGNKYTSRHSEERMRTYKKVGFPVNLLES